MVTRKEFELKERKRKEALKLRKEKVIRSLEMGELPEGFVFEPHSAMRDIYARGETIHIMGYPVKRTK